VSTQIIDAALNMAPNNQKTEVLPPAEVREDLPLPSDPKVIFHNIAKLPELLKRRRGGLETDEAGGATPGFSA
jgi:hypothetical protein